jgi:hypothetical protein
MRSARIWAIAQTETRKSVRDSILLTKWTLTRWKKSWNEQHIEVMEKQIFNLGDVVKVICSADESRLGQFVTILKMTKTQCFVVFPDGEETWMEYDRLQPSSHPNATIPIPAELYDKLSRLGLIPNDVRDHNVGKSDYSKHLIQPWAIWIDYDLNGFDADIVKRVLREKEGESRAMDYEKIIHICQERIRQLDYE